MQERLDRDALYENKRVEIDTDYSIADRSERLKQTKHEAEIYQKELDVKKKRYIAQIEKNERTIELDNQLDKKRMDCRADKDTY